MSWVSRLGRDRNAQETNPIDVGRSCGPDERAVGCVRSIDDLCDRFIDRIKCPEVPRGVLQQTEFGRYGSNRNGWLRHVADTADSLAEPVDRETARTVILA
jgi:hypothetical protein